MTISTKKKSCEFIKGTDCCFLCGIMFEDKYEGYPGGYAVDPKLGSKVCPFCFMNRYGPGGAKR